MTGFVGEGMINVCCGHVVPRVPVPVKRGNRYWCDACGQLRMSGGKSTGLHAFDWALQLRDMIEQNPDPIVIDDPGTQYGRRLVLTFGAQIRAAA